MIIFCSEAIFSINCDMDYILLCNKSKVQQETCKVIRVIKNTKQLRINLDYLYMNSQPELISQSILTYFVHRI